MHSQITHSFRRLNPRMILYGQLPPEHKLSIFLPPVRLKTMMMMIGSPRLHQLQLKAKLPAHCF
jgi:hypothetical protein